MKHNSGQSFFNQCCLLYCKTLHTYLFKIFKKMCYIGNFSLVNCQPFIFNMNFVLMMNNIYYGHYTKYHKIINGK